MNSKSCVSKLKTNKPFNGYCPLHTVSSFCWHVLNKTDFILMVLLIICRNQFKPSKWQYIKLTSQSAGPLISFRWNMREMGEWDNDRFASFGLSLCFFPPKTLSFITFKALPRLFSALPQVCRELCCNNVITAVFYNIITFRAHAVYEDGTLNVFKALN